MFSTVRRRLMSCLGKFPTPCLHSAAPCLARVHLHQHHRRTFSSEPVAVKVLYDGLCPICVTEIQFLQFLQRNQLEKVNFIDITLPEYDAGKYEDVSFEMAMEALHVIDEKNEVHRGVPGFAVMYNAVGLGWLGRFMLWPCVRPFMDKCYDIFARNRLKWTRRGGECTAGRCKKKTH